MGVIGVDEAGKGPVLGSMFAAAVRTPSLRHLPPGLTDSKQLNQAERTTLTRKLHHHPRIRITAHEVPVARIDDPDTDMNTLTLHAHTTATTALASPGDTLIADASDPRPTRFRDRLAAHHHPRMRVIAEHHADTTHPIVSAASIVAKTHRDAHITRLARTYGDIGTGYPNDPTTRTFLHDYLTTHNHLPACARASWQTSRRLIATHEQTPLDDYNPP